MEELKHDPDKVEIPAVAGGAQSNAAAVEPVSTVNCCDKVNLEIEEDIEKEKRHPPDKPVIGFKQLSQQNTMHQVLSQKVDLPNGETRDTSVVKIPEVKPTR